MKKQKKQRTLEFVLPCVKGYILPAAATPVLMIGEVIMEMIIPMLMAAIVDGGLYREADFVLKEYFSPALITDSTRFIITAGGCMVLCSLFSLLFGAFGARTCAVASQGFARNLRKKLFEKIGTFSFRNTDKFSTPSLVMRCTTDVNNLTQTFSQLIRMMFRAPVTVILATVMAFRINRSLSSLFIITLPLLAGILIVMLKKGHVRFTKMLSLYDGMNTAVQEDLTAVREVKSFVRGEDEKKKFNDAAEALRAAQVHAEKLFTFVGPIQMLIMWGCTILLLALGGKKVMVTGEMHAGALVSLISYTTQAISSLAMISFVSISLALSRVSIGRINEVMREEPDIVGAEDDSPVPDGSIEFRDVTFSYTGSADNITLSHIDLSIPAGATVGIIGGTGDGKSALVQLIPRFYDPLEGTVYIGGRDVRSYGLRQLRDGVSMVLQKNMLFSGTIRDNLRWGNENASEEQVTAAAKAAEAHDFIAAFPEGYDTELGQGGVNVSGGQKQRLCIARALLKDPKILILDDSTSAVDTATEKKIRASLKEALPGATKIIIAQRISSVREADMILVMDKGRIIASGTHEELLGTSPVYREICLSQQKGGIE